MSNKTAIQKYRQWLANLKENRAQECDSLTDGENKLLDGQIRMLAEIITDLSNTVPPESKTGITSEALAGLSKKLDEVLEQETPETLTAWLEEKRKNSKPGNTVPPESLKEEIEKIVNNGMQVLKNNYVVVARERLIKDILELFTSYSGGYNKGWIPVSERLPNPEFYLENYLVITSYGSQRVVAWNNVINKWEDADEESESAIANYITHWRPLLETPKYSAQYQIKISLLKL